MKEVGRHEVPLYKYKKEIISVKETCKYFTLEVYFGMHGAFMFLLIILLQTCLLSNVSPLVY